MEHNPVQEVEESPKAKSQDWSSKGPTSNKGDDHSHRSHGERGRHGASVVKRQMRTPKA